MEQGRDPLAPGDVDMARALYDRPGPTERRAIVQAYLEKDVTAAQAQFAKVADAYRTMPIGMLLSNPLAAGNPQGQPAANRAAEGPALGDDHQSFITKSPDSQGKNVWTDVYRFGRAVVAVQVLESSETDAATARKQIAEQVQARAK